MFHNMSYANGAIIGVPGPLVARAMDRGPHRRFPGHLRDMRAL
jgi:hypothetical protein